MMSRQGFYALVRYPPKLQVSPLRRLLTIPLAVLCALAGVGPIIDPGNYSSPIFATFRAVAPLEWWGSAFVVVAVLAMITSAWGHFTFYLATHMAASFLCGFWFLVLVKARYVDGLAVSLPAFGLWLYPALAALISITTEITTYHAVPAAEE